MAVLWLNQVQYFYWAFDSTPNCSKVVCIPFSSFQNPVWETFYDILWSYVIFLEHHITQKNMKYSVSLNLWRMLAFFAIAIGVYPFFYLVIDMTGGLLSTKGNLLTQTHWNIAFYAHILGGAIALLTGWMQFWTTFRKRYPAFHKFLGKVYLIAVLGLSSPAGFYLAWFATGGLWAGLGFGILAILWFYSTFSAYSAIRQGQVEAHKNWMIRSYAFTFAAVTLRLWLPLLINLFGMHNFMISYTIIAWLCWIPNGVVAELVIKSGWVKN
jgi:uncharacterized membrane protein